MFSISNILSSNLLYPRYNFKAKYTIIAEDFINPIPQADFLIYNSFEETFTKT